MRTFSAELVTWLGHIAFALAFFLLLALFVGGAVFGVYLAFHGHPVLGVVCAVGTLSLGAGTANYLLER